MNAITEQINAIGKAFVGFAWPMLVQSSVLILILLLVDFALRRKVRAVFRYWLWMLVLAKLVLPISLSSPVSLGNWFGDRIEQANVKWLAGAEQGQNRPGPGQAKPWQPAEAILVDEPSATEMAGEIPLVTLTPDRPAPSQTAPTIASAATTATAPVTWQGFVFLAWLAVVLAMGLLLLQRAIFVRGLVAQARKANPPMEDALQSARKQMGVTTQICLKVSANATSPAVCGLFRPVILVPHNLAPSLGSRHLRAVLLHELAHIRRGDLWVNLAQTLLQIVYFYNPLLWLANAVIRRVREQAVDEAVLVAMGERAQRYPETLVSVAKLAFQRPALSLRLIGVVESKNALAGRIKRILNRPIPRKARLGIMGLAIVLIAAAVLLPMAKAVDDSSSTSETDPLYIHLVAVRPDGCDTLYDANGKRIAEESFADIDAKWTKESQHRTFVFEFEPPEDFTLFTAPFLEVRPAGQERRLGTGGGCSLYYSGDKLALVVGVSFPRVYKQLFNRRVKKVDLTIRYYHGPRGEADLVFKGPFTAGQTIKASGRECELIAKKDILSFGNTPIAHFKVSSKNRFDTDSVLVYDVSGRRHLPEGGGGSSGQHGTSHEYHTEGLALDSIAYVTIGEKPYERTFRNVVVSYNDRPVPDRPVFLDEMSERLGRSMLYQKRSGFSRIYNPAEAIEVSDIVRGHWYVREVFNAISYGEPKTEISTLDEVTQEKIRSAATRWVKAGDPRIRSMGIRLGLKGGWTEFLDMALEMLGCDLTGLKMVGPPSGYFEKAAREHLPSDVAVYRATVSDVQVSQVKKIILEARNYRTTRPLLHLLAVTNTQAAFDACWQAAQNDRPWIWWPATDLLFRRHVHIAKLRPFENLPEKMQKRLILVREGSGSSGQLFHVSSSGKDYEALAAEAYSMLPGLLSTELAMHSRICYDVRRLMVKHLDREVAVNAMTQFLRDISQPRMQRAWAQDNFFFGCCCGLAFYIARDFNVWYAVNIGGLGTDEDEEGLPRNILELRQLTGETLKWYDGNPALKPVKLTVAGRVVDSSGNAIEGAVLDFTKLEYIVNERDHRTQQKANAGRCTTDGNGHFNFIPPQDKEFYDLDVSASGFAERKGLRVQQLPNGRYRINRENVIEMQRPGSISGRVIGSDGTPLANAKLNFLQNNHYSRRATRMELKTDYDGVFAVKDIAAGSHFLAYRQTRTVARHREHQGKRQRYFRDEYVGPCAAVVVDVEQGQTVNDVDLDLSQSTCSLEVEVKDGAGNPVPYSNIELLAKLPEGAYRFGSVFNVYHTSEDGVYHFDRLPPGRWHVQVDTKASEFGEPVEVDLVPGKTAHCRIEFKETLGRKKGTQAHVAISGTATGEGETSEFIATSSNGVTVELIGICEHPSQGKQWWRPDGGLLDEAPYDDDFGRAFPKDGENGYKFAVKFAGMAGKEVDVRIRP
ncbi:MAG: M56 family metallopeptidase, partial [Planctomycetota bacterium]